VIIFITSIAITLSFLFLGFHAVRKDWAKTFILCLIFAFSSFMVGQEWFQGFFKTQVLSMVLFSLKKYGDKIEDFHKTVETISNELSEQQKELSKTQSGLTSVQERIMKQQERLENIESLVKNVFERMTHEGFSHTQQERMIIHEMAERYAIVIFLLKSIPIYQMVEIQHHIYAQPKGSYIFSKNLVVLFWGDSIASLHNKPFVISYVADPTGRDAYNTLIRKDEGIYADAQKILWVADDGNTMLSDDETTFTVGIDAENNSFQLSIPKAAAGTSSQQESQ
jgi:uncharacterized coiled-coil protein SlyX